MSGDILDQIKKDDLDLFLLLDHLIDVNMLINGKLLVEHAVEMKSPDSLFTLLLMCPDVSSIIKTPDWEKAVSAIDPSFVQMIKDVASIDRGRSVSRAQVILDELTLNLLRKERKLFRHNMHYEDDLIKQLWVGLYWFEYIHNDYLFEYVRDTFQCGNVEDEKEAKYALVISAPTMEQMNENIPGVSQLFVAYLEMQQIPVGQLEKTLEELKKLEITLVGVHFSKEDSLRIEPDWVDVDPKFFDSMKETISRVFRKRDERPVVFYAQTFTFNELLTWDDQINSWVTAFKNAYGHWPNILLASTATYSRIDMVANAKAQNRIRNPEGETATEFVSMSGFQGNGYSLDFCIEESLAVDSIKLIYDSDPDGGLPLPEADEEVYNLGKRKVC